MSGGIGNPAPTATLVHKIRLMADSGGVLTRDRIRVLIETADRLDELSTMVAALAERNETSLNQDMFP